MIKIHPTAIVSPKAIIGEGTEILPYSIIYDDVIIGDNCIIGSHSSIYNGARIGNRVKIFQGASVSNDPQDLKYANEPATFEIGDDTVIREFVTLHKGTKETGKSSVGKNCLLMAYAHVAHDCSVGNNVIIANSCQIGGHVKIEDSVIIGGATPVHQFSHIGQHSMIGGGFRVTQDVPPYILAAGYPLKYTGLNIIGLRRRGFSNETITALKQAYNYIFNARLNLAQAKHKISEEFADNKYGQNVMTFIEESKRGILS